ncbi:hypothetical protein [Flavobacterium sp.]|jgi:hypothetical protein|uniref:hypothetical protein n=1 Tax=Flavobacterium sp. TaxID=239 RepID=UPI0037C1A72F
MKNFEKFVKHIVNKWRAEGKLILEKGGLGVPMPNKIAGDYAGALSIETSKKLQHRLKKTKAYKLFQMNATNLDFTIINEKLITSHKLGLK